MADIKDLANPDDIASISITYLQREVHKLARGKGFWDSCNGARYALNSEGVSASDVYEAFITQKLALIANECIGEALDELREHGVESEPFGMELADVVIRTFDLAEYLGIDLGKLILDKHQHNKSRARKHGKRF